ncbi:MAG: xanthine dehydrogenase family protein subunit M [Myxococcota bacterium]|nr:xanthine dehydrogenase family protein subunit M [Myxococcota bacterium]
MLAEVSLHRPGDLAEALGILAEPPGGRPLTVLAGGTDLLVLQNSGSFVPESVLDLWRLDALRGIEQREDGALWLGALSTYQDLIQSPLVQRHIPALVEASRTVGAVQIQSRGTLGGNVANASPAGDTLPVLLAHGTRVVLVSAVNGERLVDFDDFYQGYRAPDIRSGELIKGFLVDPLPEGGSSSFRKVGTRLAQAISKVMLCGVASLGSDGRVDFIRLAAGSVAPVPVRLLGAESAALGGVPAEVLDAVRDAAREDVQPIDDVRSNEEYRREVSSRLAVRFVGSL